MAIESQPSLPDTFQTARPANHIYCHQEFLEKASEHNRDAMGRRLGFLLQRLAVDSNRLHYKATAGANRGWRRSRLGGGQGSHFYAWWAPKNAVPLKDLPGFAQVPDGSVFVRDIRHHDDHSPLSAQTLDAHYLPVSVPELRHGDYTPVPWTTGQVRFATARQHVRLLKGHPGSGKTTALWNAADQTGAERVLYVTYSRDLAALARDYFDRYCSANKRFHVVTYPDLVAQLAGVESRTPDPRADRARFLRDLSAFARGIGPWTNNQVALYDEFYAHLVGGALPIQVGRFHASKHQRVDDGQFVSARTRFIGLAAAKAATDAATRLERLDTTSLAERYFPELALAWNATAKILHPGSQKPGFAALIDFDCIAVDECQDLTPIETLVLTEMAVAINRGRRTPVPILIAGDEAQTVRPTDFEWGWLSDLLHGRVGTPAEHKLSSNLRSPRHIAEVVKRVWDLYSHIQKQDRPSGAGYVEIEDDASDQILYCTAAPGAELDELLVSLSSREGLALISLEDSIPSYVPEAARSAVLTVGEAKGLDFHAVCVLDAGKHIEQIAREEHWNANGDVEGLRKRLAIDQMRVALSRATERLLWLDINPTEKVVRRSIDFLNGNDETHHAIASCVPAALLKTLGEEDLDVEERVQRCQTDARQYLDVKPEMAWSRAQQAVTLLGRAGSPAAVTDQAARDAAYLTLAEVCFTLGIRNKPLPSELGRPDLFFEAQRAATVAKKFGLGRIIESISRVHRAPPKSRLQQLVEFAGTFPPRSREADSWLIVQINAFLPTWMEEMESGVFNSRNAAVLMNVLPPLYGALGIPDKDSRLDKLRQRSTQLLMKDRQFAEALSILENAPERLHKLEAMCHEGLGNFANAAASYRLAGSLKEALQCYRSIPDFESALKLVREIGDHPAAETLEWIGKMERLIAARPEKFPKVVTTAEKKLLEDLLEKSLGVTRKKPAARKAAAPKKAATPKKAAAPKKPTVPRKLTGGPRGFY